MVQVLAAELLYLLRLRENFPRGGQHVFVSVSCQILNEMFSLSDSPRAFGDVSSCLFEGGFG